MITVIPARYASTRFPGKPLALLAGKPMIAHVWDRAVLAMEDAARVYVATDDTRIADAVQSFGGQVVMTANTHENGTERLAEVVDILALSDDEIVINLQGDEPVIDPALVRLAGDTLAQTPAADIATAADAIESEDAFHNPNIVKVVTDTHGIAHYFSRAPIPHNRDGGAVAAKRHIGIYAYRASTLKTLATLAPAPTEETEKLEQLRPMWHGMKIVVADYDGAPSIGVDTPEDLVRAAAYIQANSTP